MAIPSQARRDTSREGVETRRAAPKLRSLTANGDVVASVGGNTQCSGSNCDSPTVSATANADAIDALNPFAYAVAEQLRKDFTGSQAFQNCKAQVRARSSFRDNWFLNGFSLARAVPSLNNPFVRSGAEAIAVKGGTLASGYGGGTVLKRLGRGVDPEFEEVGLRLISAGEGLQVGAKFAGKFIGTAGTITTFGATGFDLLYPSAACYSKLD